MKQLSLLVLCSVAGVCLGAGGAVSGSSGSGVGSVTETEGTRLLLEGSPLSLTCSQNLTNTDTVWSKDGKQVVEDENTKVFKNTTLYIVSAKVDDIGEYTCEHEGQDEPKVFNVVQLKLHKNLPESTTVLENDKLALSCQVEGNPPPTVQWLKNGELMEDSINSTRLIFSENEHNVPNASLLIKPILKSDVGNYICLVKQYSLQLNTTTEVRVKDIYAALWPFLAIVAEVIILCVIIFIYEKRRIKANFDDSDSDPAPDQKSVADHNKDAEVRQRK
ncbi:basigin [Penaeus vannamei]|uniref:Basigin n=1 Tax=Penaeus vannamei TaxID=6689 RepID=A0A3R7MY06_PENVA|nr:basigin-like [Penaeus vannamei]ROT72398.1 putative neuroplastin isoform X1 [Penaeus vannamei]WLT68428.1 basigin [Penaeus vannamei]